MLNQHTGRQFTDRDWLGGTPATYTLQADGTAESPDHPGRLMVLASGNNIHNQAVYQLTAAWETDPDAVPDLFALQQAILIAENLPVLLRPPTPGTLVRFRHNPGSEIRLVDAVEPYPDGNPMIVYRSDDGITSRSSAVWVEEEARTDPADLHLLNAPRTGTFSLAGPDSWETHSYYSTSDNKVGSTNLAALLAGYATRHTGPVTVVEYDAWTDFTRKGVIGRFEVGRGNGVLTINRL